MSTLPRILITGFEPYGALPANPALDTMQALDGEDIAGLSVIGRALPVSLDRIGPALEKAMADTSPAAIIALGLCPGEAAIRLERVGLNLADFALADNDGARSTDRPLAPQGPAARWSTLPLRAIERALLAAGTPARLSETAGTYLCNACLYLSLDLLDRLGRDMPCGFIHLPLTPELAAHVIKSGSATAFDRAAPASMELSRVIAAIRLAVGATAASLQRSAPRNAGRSLVT